MRISQSQRYGFGFRVHLVADADQVQVFREPLGDSAAQFAANARANPWYAGYGFSSELLTAVRVSPFNSKRIPGGIGLDSFAFLPSISNWLSPIVTLTPLGTLIGFFPIRDIKHLCIHSRSQIPDRITESGIWNRESGIVNQLMVQSTSPPNPFSCACFPVKTPCDVDTMMMPNPPRTDGTSDFRVTLKSGRLTCSRKK
jgi:hypothetical protein